MPRSYSTAMSDIEAGGSSDFMFIVAGAVIFWFYGYIWERFKHAEPDRVKRLIATVVTLFILPPVCWLYLTIGAAIWWVFAFLGQFITKSQ